MYQHRVKIFISVLAAVLFVCVLRLGQMQLTPESSLTEQIEKLKAQEVHILKTARGKFLDRNGNILAVDVPGFELHISYQLSKIADKHIEKAVLLRAKRRDASAEKIAEIEQELREKHEYLEEMLEKISQFGPGTAETKTQIDKINNRVWRLREHLAWKRNYPDTNDFATAQPDAEKRLLLAAAVDVSEAHDTYPLIELETEDDFFTAQFEFADDEGIQIVPKNHRVYPYGNTACQTIGWVRPEHNTELFSEDPLFRYQHGELSGFAGAEYVCETILRGRRGREVYDIDRELVDRTETLVGEDVQLTIDIGLQRRIENYLVDCNENKNCDTPIAVVIIDVAAGDILAMVSVPTFDLNRVRYDYTKINSDPNHPFLNRCIESHYPPGSVVKPLILIAGMSEKKIHSGEVINCPAARAPKGWPSCWIFNQFQAGHDWSWQDSGGNIAHNAIKGSCNIYFSRLANRIESRDLQKWLYRFGYARLMSLEPADTDRHFRRTAGYISSSIPKKTAKSFSDVPILTRGEKRFFGIGQGNLRATPLQVANAMAAIARRGLYKRARLIIDESTYHPSVSLDIAPETMNTVHKGMRAVVNEYQGTAYREFKDTLDYFKLADVRVYGKTGSTQAPEHAWFGGFARDSKSRSIAIAVVVEGGQRGSSDAAPLGRDIIRFCIEAGYLGENIEYEPEE